MTASQASDVSQPSHDPSINQDAERRIMNCVRSIVRAINVNSREIEAKFGLTLAQVIVLRELDERPADSLSDLAARTMTHLSSVSVVARRLAAKGLVTRMKNPEDARRRQLTVTTAGRMVLGRMSRTVFGELVGAFEQLDPDGRDRLADLLDGWRVRSEISIAAD